MNQLALVLAALSLITPSVVGEVEKELSVYFPDYRYSEGMQPKFYGTTNLILFSATPLEDGSVDFSRIKPEMIAIISGICDSASLAL